MTSKIKCPNCGHLFDAEEALSGRIETHLRKEYEKKISEQATIFNEQKKAIDKEREELQRQAEQQDEVIKARLKEALEAEKKKIQKSTQDAFESRISDLQKDYDKQKEENKKYQQKELELLKKERELNEKSDSMALEMEKQMLLKTQEIEHKARRSEKEKFELEKRQLLKQIEDNKKLAEEMKRKAEQGSMQLQGEVQELALEEALRRLYPFDIIREVPKGVRGADSIQTVVNAHQQECGTIVYESKRTKNFSNDWIEKLKHDMVCVKADIAVLVTENFPSGMDRFGERNGVWICGYHEVQGVSLVLREMLIRTHSVKMAQTNKGSKMELLYAYLTSNEFVQNIKRIVENYDMMIRQLNAEKKAMHKLWATREKQIWVVQENISAFFGSIKGIAGGELETSDVLELSAQGGDEDAEEL